MQTATEILEAIGKLPQDQQQALHTGLTPILTGAGFVVRTKDEDTAYTNQQVKLKADQIAEENFNKKYKEKLDEYDQLIFKLTGVEKKPMQSNGPNEKTSEYLTRALKEYEAKGQTADAKMVRELQQKLQETESTYEKKLKDKDSEIFDFKNITNFNAELATRNIVVPATLTDEKEKQQYIEQAKESLRLQFFNKYKPKTDDKGNIIYFNAEDQAQLGNGGQPLGVKDLIDQSFKSWFVPQGKQQPGLGGAPGSNGGGPGANGKYADTKAIHAHLKEKGIDARSPEYQNEFTKLAKESGINL